MKSKVNMKSKVDEICQKVDKLNKASARSAQAKVLVSEKKYTIYPWKH